MSEIDAHELAVEVPPGWEGRIFRRAQAGELRASEVSGATAPAGEKTFPVVHLATVPVPMDAADYGAGIVENLGPNDVFLVLKEFDPAETAEALFVLEGLPRALDPDHFSPSALQRQLPRQAGLQVFFHEGSRPFCLYVVLGDYAHRQKLVPDVNALLETIRIAPAAVVAP